MEAIKKLNKWANARTNIGFDLLRIAIGVFFFIKGIQFVDQTALLVELIRPVNPNSIGLFIAHYVAMAHFAGGMLIAFGLLTRLSCLVQIPIVVGAVLVNFTGVMDWSNLTQASLALIVTVFFVIYGSGKHSVDYALKLQQ